MTETIVVQAEHSGQRLDVVAAACTGKTRSQIKQLLQNGLLTVNGAPDKGGRIVKEGDEICITTRDVPLCAEPQEIALDILYEDDDIVVLNKAQGMSVHPGAGNRDGTLVNALLYHVGALSQAGGAERPGIVHRLDKDTSGVLVAAKNDFAHLSLSRQIADRKVQKLYTAVLEGNLKSDEGEVVTGIGRSPRDRKKMAVLPAGGKTAITHYRVQKRYKNNCLVQFDIKTGRTHQIRVHAQYLGHPVVGDKTYGYLKQRFDLKGQLLHASSISFTHPRTNQRVTFTAPLPDYFLRVCALLEKETEED